MTPESPKSLIGEMPEGDVSGLLGLSGMASDLEDEPYIPDWDDDTRCPADDEEDPAIVGADIESCVDTAFSMLPVEVCKPIFQQGVWRGILGDGHFLKQQFEQKLLPRPIQAWTDQALATLAVEPSVKRLKIARDVGGPNFAKCVQNKSELTWQEERESMLQQALKRWMVALASCDPSCSIRRQLDDAGSEKEQFQLLADVFCGRAPATLLKRVRAVEKF